jgi:tripartite-type tricarboxylate transporter receptor subunit TctC
MLLRRQFIASSAAACIAPTLPARAQGAKFTDRQIKLVVPFAAGGGVDVYARLIAEKLRQSHGYAIIVENRAGANGTVGGAAVKAADADGTTLLFSAGTHVMAREVMKSSPYDPHEDFAAIARVGEAPMMLVMAPQAAPNTLTELIAAAKAAPDKWTFATSAIGAPGHLATIAFNHATGLDLKILPYRGTALGLNDVAGGHVQLMIDPVLALLPMANARTVKGVMITSPKRTKIAPEIASAAEAGLKDFDHASWYGVWGPKATPAPLAQAINAAMNAAIAELDKEGKLEKVGVEPVVETPEAFAAFGRAYSARNAELLKAANFERV